MTTQQQAGRDAEPIDVVVAGVPYSYSGPVNDGKWLTDAHCERIRLVSHRIRLEHMSSDELREGKRPRHQPTVILTECNGVDDHYDDSDWLQGIVRGRDLVDLISPKLEWVQSCSHGNEHLVPMFDDTVQLVRGKGIHSAGLAESIIGAMLFHAKRVEQRLANQRERLWRNIDPQDELEGATICIVGTGSNGTALARLAKAFGMHVVGVRRRALPAPSFDEVVTSERLNAVLPRAQYVAITCPLTDATRGMFGPEQFALLPEGAYYVGVCRGAIVDEDALLSALRSGRLSGAFLDSFTHEPLPADHPLWDAPNTLISPHDSHLSAGVADRNVALLCRNLERHLAGEPLDGRFDRRQGY